MDVIKVILVDDNPSFLKGLSKFVARDKRFIVIGQFNSGEELLESQDLVSADLILLDIELPGLSGSQTAKQIGFLYPQIKLIAITMYQEKVYLKQLIAVGFNGFVNKATVPDGLLTSINEVLNGQLSFPMDLEF